MEIPAQQAKDCGFGPHPVHVLPSIFVTMSDGVHLAVRLWLPSSSVLSNHFPGETSWLVYSGDSDSSPGEAPTSMNFPVVLEYLPYRKDDVTAVRDHQRHVWMASHGIAVARADLRGSGDSDGRFTDEYSPEELLDGRQLIAWLAVQPWTNGRIGIYGKSWGGFNGLQLAELGCPGLAAVISIYSTDDRYNSDIHYSGGCVIGTEALTWSSFMLAINSLPPSPAVRPADWLDTWLDRLNSDGHRPCLDTWLRHQTPDEYWRRGSVKFSLDRLTVPVLLVGGWHDMYSDALLRLADRLPNSASGALLGPWSHEWPDTATPGPNLAFMDECLRWWRLHLTGAADGGAPTSLPARFRAFQRVEDAPARSANVWRGRWLAADSYQSLLQPGGGVKFHLTRNQQLVPDMAKLDDSRDTDWSVDISSRVECGFAYPEFLSSCNKDGAPDQSGSNRMATVWQLDSLPEDLDLFGSAEVTLNLQIVQAGKSTVPTAASPTIGVRLCERDPDSGRETLVAWGVANLNLLQDTQGFAIDETRRFSSGRVVVRLRAATHRFARGRAIVLALSAGLWPLAWRCPSSGGWLMQLRVSADHSEANILRLPLLNPETAAAARQLALKDAVLSAPPRLGPPPPMLDLSSQDSSFGTADQNFRRWLEWDLVTERWVHHMESDHCPVMELLLPGEYRVRLRWHRHYWQGIGGGVNSDGGDCNPTSEAEHRLEVSWPAQQTDVAVNARCFLGYDSSDGRAEFVSRARLRILLNGEEFFCRDFSDRVPNATA